jgi:hypothetical protein
MPPTAVDDPGKANFAAIPTGGAFTSLDAVGAGLTDVAVC